MDKTPLELFRNSGRFTNVKSYLEKNPKAVVHDKCTDVVVYNIAGCDIQVLNTGEFYFNEDIRGYSLDKVELELFEKKVEKK